MSRSTTTRPTRGSSAPRRRGVRARLGAAAVALGREAVDQATVNGVPAVAHLGVQQVAHVAAAMRARVELQGAHLRSHFVERHPHVAVLFLRTEGGHPGGDRSAETTRRRKVAGEGTVSAAQIFEIRGRKAELSDSEGSQARGGEAGGWNNDPFRAR